MTLNEYREIRHPTLEQLEQVESDFIFPKDAAVFIRCDPHNINIRAKTDMEKFGKIVTLEFDAFFQGRTLYIPRVPFIQYMRTKIRGEDLRPKPSVENLDDILTALDTLRNQVFVMRECLARPFPN